MGLFTDTVTYYHKVSEEEWIRTVVEGVQWSEKTEKKLVDGKLSVVPYISITFPEGTHENLPLDIYSEEDCIVYGEVKDVVSGAKGQRVSDLMGKYPKSGRIRSVRDNSKRSYLKIKKVVVG